MSDRLDTYGIEGHDLEPVGEDFDGVRYFIAEEVQDNMAAMVSFIFAQVENGELLKYPESLVSSIVMTLAATGLLPEAMNKGLLAIQDEFDSEEIIH